MAHWPIPVTNQMSDLCCQPINSYLKSSRQMIEGSESHMELNTPEKIQQPKHSLHQGHSIRFQSDPDGTKFLNQRSRLQCHDMGHTPVPELSIL